MGCIAVNAPITIYEGGTYDQTFQWKTGETPEACIAANTIADANWTRIATGATY